MKKSIKKIVKTMCILVALLLLCQSNIVPAKMGTATVQAASKKTKKNALKAYRRILSKDIRWSDSYYISSKKVRFNCIDINKDGVKELVLYYMEAPHMYGWNRIYTYAGGRVKSLGYFTDITIYKNKNYFSDCYSNTGNVDLHYYRLGKNGKKIRLAEYSFSDYKPYGESGVVKRYINGYPYYYHAFKVNGKRTTYKKCMRKKKSLEKKAKETKIKYHTNTAANRRRYVK